MSGGHAPFLISSPSAISEATLRNREKAKAWYNAHPDRAIEYQRQRLRNPRIRARRNRWLREYRRRKRAEARAANPRSCVDCGRELILRQRKYCLPCREVHISMNRELSRSRLAKKRDLTKRDSAPTMRA